MTIEQQRLEREATLAAAAKRKKAEAELEDVLKELSTERAAVADLRKQKKNLELDTIQDEEFRERIAKLKVVYKELVASCEAKFAEEQRIGHKLSEVNGRLFLLRAQEAQKNGAIASLLKEIAKCTEENEEKQLVARKLTLIIEEYRGIAKNLKKEVEELTVYIKKETENLEKRRVELQTWSDDLTVYDRRIRASYAREFPGINIPERK